MATALELQHFALLDITYDHKTTFITIQVNTNNPCHLTSYYTAIKPVRHKTTRIVRGLPAPWGAYWCFVAWKSVEQQEAGDTWSHTFDIPAWSYCQTNWFTFRGTISGVLSPSNTPIIQHHHPGVHTIATYYVSQKAYYRCFRSANPGDPDLVYLDAHDQLQADNYHTGVMLYGQRIRVVGTYAAAMIRRLAITFNTIIPPPIQLISATLRLDMRKITPPIGYSPNWDWYVKIRAGQDLNSIITHGDLNNYWRILLLGIEVASKYADDLPDPGFQDYWYVDIPIEYINTTGYTVITSLTSKDETSTRPGNNIVEEPLFIAGAFTKLDLEYYQL